ncbi:tyrosine-type recombinase/integrase, partial [Streptomyces sp. 24-1644]
MSTLERVQPATGLLERLMEVVRPEFRGEDAYHRHHRVIRGCAVRGCRRSRICTRHTELWQAAGAPDLDTWLATARYEAPPHGERDCVLPDCPWWTTGPGSVVCRRHYIRWRNNGHPELPDDQL